MALKNKLLTFAVALAACGFGFWLLDIGLMSMQGLPLMFEK